jgi:hypothetical protein
MIRQFALAAVAVFALSTLAQAGTVNGSKAIGTLGPVGAAGNDIHTATTFTLGATFFGGTAMPPSGTNDFFTYSPNAAQATATTLDLTNITAFSFGNATTGGFTASSYQVYPPNATQVGFYLLGTFTPGTDFGGLFSAGPASMSISFTQSAPGGNISVSGTLNTPPGTAPAPEPSTIATALMGLAFAGFAARRRLAK